MNTVAALDAARSVFNDAEAFASKALSTAEHISEANEALSAQAMLARSALAVGGPRRAAQATKALQAALALPSDFSARALRSAHEAAEGFQPQDKGRAVLPIQ